MGAASVSNGRETAYGVRRATSSVTTSLGGGAGSGNGAISITVGQNQRSEPGLYSRGRSLWCRVTHRRRREPGCVPRPLAVPRDQ